MEPAEVAEDFMAHVPLPASGQRRNLGNAWLVHQPGPVPLFANVSGLRARDLTEVDVVQEQADQWFAALGRRHFVWFLGPHSRPAGARDHLLANGATVLATSTAMTLDHPPASGSTSQVEVREVLSAEELLEYWKLMTPAGGPGMDADAAVEHLVRSNDAAWREYVGMHGARRYYLAYLEDAPVAAGGVAFTTHGVAILTGGATSAQARGNGCYRALLARRWAAAVEAGASHLAVVASDESRPILDRSGFASVAQVTFLRQGVRSS
ncbi:MAG: hypothetical protein JOZ82_03340 [Marmoricola sp.]|nr:hypothetical protein [Marmoricola sp.]